MIHLRLFTESLLYIQPLDSYKNVLHRLFAFMKHTKTKASNNFFNFREKIKLTLLTITLLLYSFIPFYFQQNENVKEIIKKADEKMRGKTSMAEITIQVVRPSWSREIKLKMWSKGNTYSIILLTAPAKEKGIVFLKRDKEVWNWIPSIERVIKMPPSMMSQSWMGTDFTNDDLVKESSIVDDYEHFMVGDTTILGRDCHKIKLIPKPEAAVVWGKIILWIDKKDYIQLKAELYDEEEELISTMQSSEIKMLGGRLLPSRTEMIPRDKKNQKTIMLFNQLRFDELIEDNFFSPDNMKKIY